MSVMRDLPSPVQINITGFGAGGGGTGAKELASITAADGRILCDCFNATMESEALEDFLRKKQKPRKFCS